MRVSWTDVSGFHPFFASRLSPRVVSACWRLGVLVLVSWVSGGLDPISATLKKLVMVPWSRVARPRPPELGHITVILRSIADDFFNWIT